MWDDEDFEDMADVRRGRRRPASLRMVLINYSCWRWHEIVLYGLTFAAEYL
jgi:hypothetical protein